MTDFDDYMFKKLTKLKAAHDEYRKAKGVKNQQAAIKGIPDAELEFVTGTWPAEFDRILNGEPASMIARDAQEGKL